jgi:hypothetical protein
MQKPIPAKMREEMNNDPFMHSCCLANENCEGLIEWHHNLIYGGKRQNEKWAILPLCSWHHAIEKQKDIKKELNKIMVFRATEEELIPFCKVVDWISLKYAQN